MTDAFWNRDDYDDPVRMRNDMERFFSQFPRWKKPSAFFVRAWEPLCDVYEGEDRFTVIVELAGVDEERVEVTLQGRTLTIRGSRAQVRPADVVNTHLLEINYGDFMRVLELPEDVDPDGTRAVYRAGMLEISLPKLKGERLRGVDVKSG